MTLEYRIEEPEFTTDTPLLNRLALEGWRVVGTWPPSYVLLEREKPEAEEIDSGDRHIERRRFPWMKIAIAVWWIGVAGWLFDVYVTWWKYN